MLSVNPGAEPRAADVLAGESTADDIDVPAPRLAVEGSHVIPDWESWQHAIALPLQEHLAAVGFDFNGANWVMSELFGALNRLGKSIEDSPVSPAQAAELLTLVTDGTLSGSLAKQVFEKMLETGDSGEPSLNATA